MPTSNNFRARARIIKKQVQTDSRQDKPTFGRPQLFLELEVFESYEAQTKTWTPLAKPMRVKCYWPFAVADRNTGEVLWWESKINSCRKALRWDGQTWESLEALDTTGLVIQIVGEWSEYKGTRTPRIQWLNPDGERAKDTDLKALDQEFPPPPGNVTAPKSDAPRGEDTPF